MTPVTHERPGRLPALLRAYAKLTLSLRVVGVRADGYHLIDSEMVSVDLADSIRLDAGEGIVVSGATGAPVAADRSNLVWRALEATGRVASVELSKRIPAGAGLGGGSADAAAILRWAGCHDPAVAAGLGSDVPFCVVGGRARVTGVGEHVTSLPFEEVRERSYTLLMPPLAVPTADVYREWDRQGGSPAPGGNDLEPAALAVEPRLATWRDILADATGEQPSLAGSGSTWWVPGAHPGPGRIVVRPVAPESS